MLQVANSKERSTVATEAIECALTEKYGKYEAIDLVDYGDAKFFSNEGTNLDMFCFKNAIKKAGYHVQILHCLVSSGLDDWFYVTALLSNIV